MSATDREAELLTLLAERPFDRALRLVFSDFLQERGDPRGEAIALSLKLAPSVGDRRRLQRLIETYDGLWLGPLLAVLEPQSTRWVEGFADELRLQRGLSAEALVAARGDPRLATVRRLWLPLEPPREALGEFLSHPVLRSVTHLRATQGTLDGLAATRPAFTLTSLCLASWGDFAGELSVLGRVPWLGSVREVSLASAEFINATTGAALRQAVLAQLGPEQAVQVLRIIAAWGAIEGVAAVLSVQDDVHRLGTAWPGDRRLGVDYADCAFTLHREGGAGFERLEIDVTGADGSVGLGARLATTASVLVLLGRLSLHTVEVTLPQGARVRPAERDALRAAVRRLRSVERLSLGGESVTP